MSNPRPVFWYHESRIYAVVTSMFVGMIAAAVWRFGLGSPGDVGPALFGFGAAALAFGVALPLTIRLRRGWLFCPHGENSDEESP